MKNYFHLKVQSREGVIYENDVESISSYNDVGLFDVLPQHANFISLIKQKLIIKEKNLQQAKEISFDIALLRVRENNVEVYIGVEGLVSQTY